MLDVVRSVDLAIDFSEIACLYEHLLATEEKCNGKYGYLFFLRNHRGYDLTYDYQHFSKMFKSQGLTMKVNENCLSFQPRH